MTRKRKRLNDATNDNQPPKQASITGVLPEGVVHYGTSGEVPWDTHHYWRQRHSLFSKYDEGIWMTDDAWFGVTPECIARSIASDMATAVPDGRSIIVDAFCGAGGNTIAFALSGKWKRVYSIEKDPATLECAKHNAKIYGVENLITWFQGDCFEVLGTNEEQSENAIEALGAVIREFGVIFASPPWGGPSYRNQEIFDLNTMQPYGLDFMVEHFRKLTTNMVLYLPRTSDLRQIAEHADRDKKAQIRHYCTRYKSRALCAYLGDWKKVAEVEE